MLTSGTRLANGLEITIDDQTFRYFGDYHRVRIGITATIMLSQVAGLTPQEQELATQKLPQTVQFRKMLEKMGVGSAEVQSTCDELLANFEQFALPYLSGHDFPARLVRNALLAKPRKAVLGR